MAAGKRDRLMSDSQWDDFWTMIESKRAFCEAPLAKLPQIALAGRPVVVVRRPTSPESATSAPHAKGRDHETIPHAKGRNQRSHRCGNCAACRAQDCGRCKNCRDKPRCVCLALRWVLPALRRACWSFPVHMAPSAVWYPCHLFPRVSPMTAHLGHPVWDDPPPLATTLQPISPHLPLTSPVALWRLSQIWWARHKKEGVPRSHMPS